MLKFKMKCQYITIYSAGTVFLLLGFITTAFWWYLYNDIVLKRLPLSNNSDSQTFALWTSTEVPLYFSIYMFNWTNAEATVTKKEKPALQQVGPYVYRLEIYRKNFVWSDDNDTLTYQTGQRFYFVPELSAGNPTADIIITPNVILITIIRHLVSLPKLLKWPTDMGITLLLEKLAKVSLYVQKTTGELLFEGYDDLILDRLRLPKKLLKYVITTLKKLPDRFPGYLPRNGTMEYILNMYAGKRDLNKFGLLHAYNYETEFQNKFEGSCGRVQGSTAGDFWPVDIADKQNASLLIPDFCSSLQLENVGDHDVDGVEGVRFEGEETTFDNGVLHSEKQCYCPNKKCTWKSGIRDVSSCVDAPVFISFPHFYAADPSFLDQVNGLSPNKDLHAFHVTLQKQYGILLNGAIRLQINIHLEPFTDFTMLRNVPDVFLPTLWFETRINLPSKVSDKLHFSFTTVPLIFNIVGCVLLLSGFIILLSKLILR